MVEEKKEEYPLQSEWILWEHKASDNNNPDEWKANMTKVCSFKTVVDFWRYWNHIPTPSSVFFDGEYKKKLDGKTIAEYSLFQTGIEPEWGDKANVTGGEFFCRQSFDGDVLDAYWNNLVMAVIGEVLSSEYVNGCRVVDKSRHYPMFKLELWLSSRDPQVKESVKETLLKIIDADTPAPAVGRKAHPKFDWKDHTA